MAFRQQHGLPLGLSVDTDGHRRDERRRTRAGSPHANPWLVAIIVTLGAFMEVLDTTIVNVSLPHIAGSLSVSSDEATWALTTYLVANGIVLTISGALSRAFGRKRYFLICIGVFTVCSLAAASADSFQRDPAVPRRCRVFSAAACSRHSSRSSSITSRRRSASRRFR